VAAHGSVVVTARSTRSLTGYKWSKFNSMINYGLAGKVALVTGVSRHAVIGAAIANALAEAGANIFTTYYRPYDELMPWGSNASEAEEIVKGLRDQGVRR
jgi:3-oxoacyl-[acyl-carrier protein] reductase